MAWGDGLELALTWGADHPSMKQGAGGIKPGRERPEPREEPSGCRSLSELLGGTDQSHSPRGTEAGEKPCGQDAGGIPRTPNPSPDLGRVSEVGTGTVLDAPGASDGPQMWRLGVATQSPLVQGTSL